MREIHVDTIVKVVEELCIDANYNLPWDIKKALDKAVETERSTLGKDILKDIVKNAEIASRHLYPCRRSGLW